MHRAYDPPIDDHMLCKYTARDAGGLADDQNTGAALNRYDVTCYFAINAQAVREFEAAFNAGALRDQAFNGRLFFFTKHAVILDVTVCSKFEGLHGAGNSALNNLGCNCFYHGLGWQIENAFNAPVLPELQDLHTAR